MTSGAAPVPWVAARARVSAQTIVQIACVTRERLSASFAEAVLRDATRYTLADLPRARVNEREAQGLVEALVRRAGPDAAVRLLHEAGVRTAGYLLERRIPHSMQALIRLLPRQIAFLLLMDMVRRNAWTFAGSAHVGILRRRDGADMVVAHCSMCRGMHEHIPMCTFYRGTLERLISELVAPFAFVEEVECMAQNAAVCRFEIRNIW